MAKKKPAPYFHVHPSVVFQLGESLISDAVQALIELVKNCYDADATYAKVTIDTKGTIEVDDTFYSPMGGQIIVEDDGFGMKPENIESDWFTISNRKKREMKLAKKTTPKGRTPLGDKGLGRLGVQRLGENLEIFTKTKQNGPAHHFGFSWLDFQTAPSLEEVEIKINEVRYPSKKGTKLVVTELRDPAIWQGQSAIKHLEEELSRMISPYREIRDFIVYIEVDGKKLDLIEISDKVRDIAPIRYKLKFDGTKLLVNGRARLDFFRPQNSKEIEHFERLVEHDGGEAFYDFLLKQNRAKAIKLRKANSKKWFCEFSFEKDLSEIDKVECIDSINSNIANPGIFTGEVDTFDLGNVAFKRQWKECPVAH